MGNFANRSVPQKPMTMICACTDKLYKKRDGSSGSATHFTFKDGNVTYSVDIQKADGSKTNRRGHKITAWATVARFTNQGSGALY